MKNLKHATRMWISKRTSFANVFFRKLKRYFKGIYIQYYISRIYLKRLRDSYDESFPCIEPTGFIWQIWEGFILLVTLLNFVYIPLMYGFSLSDDDYHIKFYSGIVMLIEMGRCLVTGYFEKGTQIMRIS